MGKQSVRESFKRAKWLAAALVLAGSLILTGCDLIPDSAPAGKDNAQKAAPVQTTDPEPTENEARDSMTEDGEEPAGGQTPSSTAPGNQGGLGNQAQATAAQWKTFTDMAGWISFELPQEWDVEVLEHFEHTLRLEVSDSGGTVLATFETGIMGLGGSCQDGIDRPYQVLANIPLDIPAGSGDPNAVAPHFAYRVIDTGSGHRASYGITDHSAGPDGKACMVYNTVTSERFGIYMFGDVLMFTGDSDGPPNLRTFATVDDARGYVLTSEFQNIQKMITSLKALD